MKKWLPLIVAGVFAAWVGSTARMPSAKPDTYSFNSFGALPIVSNGRIQPLDSLARNALLQLREKQKANLEPWKAWWSGPKILTAPEWLMGMMMKPAVADSWPVIRIDHPDLKGLLALPADADPENADPAQRTDGKQFSWNQIKPKLADLQREARRAGEVTDQKRTPYDQAVVRLWKQVGLYMNLQNSVQPQNAQDWMAELNAFAAHAVPGVQALMAKNADQPFDAAALNRIMPDLERIEVMLQMESPLMIPPNQPGIPGKDWRRTVDAIREIAQGETMGFGLSAYARQSSAYASGDVAGFNAALADYRAALEQHFGAEMKKASREQFFNNLEPFYKAMLIYLVALLAAMGFWFAPQGLEWLRRTAVGLVWVALAVHTAGLVFRMVLEGRPPVTNLYSSAIFIGWGACVLGLILERFWRNSIGVVVSSTIGFLTLIIAHHLSLGGDTMEMMRAVLDTNFWLATHVVVVTLGYASTFVAGFLAMVYILRGVLTTSLDAATAKSLAKMVYGIVCFATLFSFVGTVLGGIWADQSWGRFWGWDPKENGALIIVLWNALILHARWGGLVRERGLMNLAIFGNVVTSWSWFGVNMLGIGLHSYGFMEAGFRWLMVFMGSQVLLILLGSMPPGLWRSNAFRKAGA